MAKQHRVELNNETFSAHSGEVLLDAALVAGVDVPHDCRAGRCGTCITRIRRGVTLGGETQHRGMVYACQARVFSDLSLSIESLPAVKRVDGQVMHVVDLSHDVVEVTLRPAVPLDILPGQYCRFTFRGFPARAFSPTAPLDGAPDNGKIRLNIRRLENGLVSANIGKIIKRGHRLIIDGPFGHAFLRPQQSNRLILVGTGTGFAPVWAICDAALKENPARDIVVVTGARTIASLYMWRALGLASRFRNVTVIATLEQGFASHPQLKPGRLLDHIPAMTRDDIVYAAGSPAMVEAMGRLSQQAQALFYRDPFEAAANGSDDWITRALDWLRTG